MEEFIEYFETQTTQGSYSDFVEWCTANDKQAIPLSIWWPMLGKYLYIKATYPSYPLKDSLVLASRDLDASIKSFSSFIDKQPNTAVQASCCGGGRVL